VQDLPVPDEDLAKAHFCKEPGDFYSQGAREAIGRFASKYLQDTKLTPIELLHHAQHQINYGGAGMNLLQAVQKAAGLQVKGSNKPVAERVRQLTDLADKNRNDIRAQHKLDMPLRVGKEELGQMLIPVAEEDEETRAFRIYCRLARTLEDTKDWLEKFESLLDLGELVSGTKNFKYFDEMMSEIMRIPAAFEGIIGRLDPLDEELRRLFMLYGRSVDPDLAPETPAMVKRVYKLAADNEMPACRDVFMIHLLTKVRSTDKLTNIDKVQFELNAVFSLIDRLRIDEENFLGGQPTADALERRIGLQINDETIDALMEDAANQADKMSRSVELHERILGEWGHKYLQEFVLSLSKDSQLGRKLAATAHPLEAVKAIGRVEQVAQGSTMGERAKERLTVELSKRQGELIQMSKLYEVIEKRQKNTAIQALSGHVVGGTGRKRAFPDRPTQ
jgi:hypothetical protein